MHLARGVVLALVCSAALCIAACATSMKADPPPGLNLAGNWKLDTAASDDPQKLLDQMRNEAERIIARSLRQQGYGAPRDQGGGTGGYDDYPPGSGGPGGAGPGRDPLRRSPMAHTIMTAVERGEFLTIRQSADEFVLDYGGTRRSFTPGQHSVVSAEDGVGDQRTGWSGRSYVIEVRQQYGSTITEEYSLGGSGELVEKLRVGAAELPAVTLMRIYRRNDSAPRLAPSND
jgi:hypothetical protein